MGKTTKDRCFKKRKWDGYNPFSVLVVLSSTGGALEHTSIECCLLRSFNHSTTQQLNNSTDNCCSRKKGGEQTWQPWERIYCDGRSVGGRRIGTNLTAWGCSGKPGVKETSSPSTWGTVEGGLGLQVKFSKHSLGDGDEIAQHAVEVHELPEDLEGTCKDAFHGEEKIDEVQPFLDGADVLSRYTSS